MEIALTPYIGQNPYQHLFSAFISGICVLSILPVGPKILQNWKENKFVQWLIVFIFIWVLSSGGYPDYEDVMVSIFMTLALYFATQVIDYNYNKSTKTE